MFFIYIIFVLFFAGCTKVPDLNWVNVDFGREGQNSNFIRTNLTPTDKKVNSKSKFSIRRFHVYKSVSGAIDSKTYQDEVLILRKSDVCLISKGGKMKTKKLPNSTGKKQIWITRDYIVLTDESPNAYVIYKKYMDVYDWTKVDLSGFASYVIESDGVLLISTALQDVSAYRYEYRYNKYVKMWSYWYRSGACGYSINSNLELCGKHKEYCGFVSSDGEFHLISVANGERIANFYTSDTKFCGVKYESKGDNVIFWTDNSLVIFAIGSEFHFINIEGLKQFLIHNSFALLDCDGKYLLSDLKSLKNSKAFSVKEYKGSLYGLGDLFAIVTGKKAKIVNLISEKTVKEIEMEDNIKRIDFVNDKKFIIVTEKFDHSMYYITKQ